LAGDETALRAADGRSAGWQARKLDRVPIHIADRSARQDLAPMGAAGAQIDQRVVLNFVHDRVT
jgi:hypothetical protein